MRNELPEKIKFFYIKNPLFRVIHVDGALGGITPRGLIHIGVFSERPAIPQSITQEVEPDGRLGEPSSREGKEGIVRELDADLMLSKRSAIELRDWLTERINELTAAERQAEGAVNAGE